MSYPFYNQNQQPQVSFMSIRGKEIAVNYPIAPNNTIIFRDELEPYIYVKSMGYSPLDKPVIDIYRREEPNLAQESTPKVKEDNSTIEKMQDDIKAIFDDIEGIKKKINTKPRRKEIEDDE